VPVSKWGLRLTTAVLCFLAMASAGRADTTWSVIPRVAFPEGVKDSHGATQYSYRFSVRGEGFRNDTDYQLVFKDQSMLTACRTVTAACSIAVTYKGDHEIEFSGLPWKLHGANSLISVQPVSIAAGQPAAPQPAVAVDIAFSRVGYWTPLFVTVGIVVLLAFLVYTILQDGSRQLLANGSSVSLGRALLMDPDTSTYSLSKLQFYIWTFAAITGYLYLSVATSLVQGHFQLADVPGNLPGIVLVSVGTTIGAAAITGMAGAKGSGDFHPSAADLISSGGVVAPERLQHLLWTIVGGAGFLFFTLMISPAQIETLPTIPDGFLELMGISAAGYLGGKIARGPGPNIRSITGVVTAAPNAIALTIDGVNLATKGASTFLAAMPGGQDVAVTITWATGANQSVIDPTGMATRLIASVPAPDGLTFTAGQSYRFTIVNPDGEKSSWEFQAT
jgi:hypothetical protein